MDMNSPLVSVVLPVYNGQEYLDDCIRSVLTQTYNNIELIVIDDGSVDKTSEVIEKYKYDSRLVCISQSNKGLVYSLNKGISLARGDYIMRMDADDICHPNRVNAQVEYFKENSGVAVLGTRAYVIDCRGNVFATKKCPLTHKRIMTGFLFDSTIIHPTVMFNMTVINKLDLVYSEEYFPAEDMELWLRLGRKYVLHNLKAKLLYYRVNPCGVSKTRRDEQYQRKIDILNRYFSGFNHVDNFLVKYPINADGCFVEIAGVSMLGRLLLNNNLSRSVIIYYFLVCVKNFLISRMR